MKIKTRALGALLGICAFGVLATAAVRPTGLTRKASSSTFRIRTEPGMFDEYMKYVAGPYNMMKSRGHR